MTVKRTVRDTAALAAILSSAMVFLTYSERGSLYYLSLHSLIFTYSFLTNILSSQTTHYEFRTWNKICSYLKLRRAVTGNSIAATLHIHGTEMKLNFFLDEEFVVW
jgi:hypothetical protein